MSNLRLKDDLPTVIEGEGIASQDTLANEHLVTKYVDDKRWRIRRVLVDGSVSWVGEEASGYFLWNFRSTSQKYNTSAITVRAATT